MKQAFITLLAISLFACFSPNAVAQDHEEGKMVIDTVEKVIQIKPSEHLLGVRYSFAYTGVHMSVEMKEKGVISPLNFALLYTYYQPLWGYNYFGLQTGIKYGSFGFTTDYSNVYPHFEQTVTTLELPLVSAFKVDLGKYFRILLDLGAFGGYILTTTKDNGFDCFDNRITYGVLGGVGFAVKVRPVEFHISAHYQYYLSMLYNQERFSSTWWFYSHPWQVSVSFGIHVKLK